MTDVELTYEVPFSQVPLQPKPEQCREPTVASFTVSHPVRDNGFVDTEIVVWRSCGHWYFATYEPEIGSLCNLPCLGPEPETRVSGRADPSLPPMKRGRRWTVVKPEKVA